MTGIKESELKQYFEKDKIIKEANAETKRLTELVKQLTGQLEQANVVITRLCNSAKEHNEWAEWAQDRLKTKGDN